MNKLNIDDTTSVILVKHGAFFAFSGDQYRESKQEGVKYTSIAHGLICPADNAVQLLRDLNSAHQAKIEWELEHNSKKDIIWFELNNHECQISMVIDPVIEKLAPYGITEEEIRTEWGPYFQNCVENDYF